MATNIEHQTSRISVRMTTVEKQMLKQAAIGAGTSVSEFVRHYALFAAQEQNAGRIVSLSPEAYAEFQRCLDAPPSPSPKLRELFERESQWEEQSERPAPIQINHDGAS